MLCTYTQVFWWSAGVCHYFLITLIKANINATSYNDIFLWHQFGFNRFVMRESDWSDIKHLWDELESWLRARPYITLVASLINRLSSQEKQQCELFLQEPQNDIFYVTKPSCGCSNCHSFVITVAVISNNLFLLLHLPPFGLALLFLQTEVAALSGLVWLSALCFLSCRSPEDRPLSHSLVQLPHGAFLHTTLVSGHFVENTLHNTTAANPQRILYCMRACVCQPSLSVFVCGVCVHC